jgi:eukaryotic-like serine/threonine-protein kinase
VPSSRQIPETGGALFFAGGFVMIGQTISHYKILEHLGGGGMGVVYKAQDLRLDRLVALKFLPPDHTRDPEAKQRFIHEAKAASALQHNNICVVHDIEETQDGQIFISMEHIEGETLTKMIERKRLRIEEIVDVATQVAQGLVKAHKHGIIHRDIKPANVMMTSDGVVKIVDFGLAKLSGRTMLTRVGVTLGTVAYLSPEQANGHRVDRRADIWSLGVMLYEMITGRLPFRGDYEQAIIYQILNAEPEPVMKLRPETPIELQRIVEKAMQKDLRERYQEVQTMCNDLQSLKSRSSTPTSVGPPDRKPRWKQPWFLRIAGLVALIGILAVAGTVFLSRRPAAIDSVVLLPFVNATGDSTLEYLCDGLTETLINTFSQLPRLHVIARTTAFSYKGKEQDPQKIGEALNVRAVLTGKIVQRGGVLTIQADLVDAREGTQLWGERYNRQLRDILTLQEEIAKRISERLRLRLSGDEQRRLTRMYTEDTEAYQLYLKGRYWSERLTQEGFQKAVEFFMRAIEKDPAYALAYTGLADAYYWVSNMYLPPKEAMEKSRWAAMRAIERDSLLGEAHLSLALVKMAYDFDWPGSEVEFHRAIELNPGFAWAHFWFGRYLAFMGRFEEAAAELERAKQLDPLSPFISIEVGLPPMLMRQYDKALENARNVVEANPSFYFAHYVLGDQYIQKGDYARAITEFQAALRLDDSPVILAGLGKAYAAAGDTTKANSIVRDLSARPYPPPYDIALIYCVMGMKGQAVQWLEKAYEDRNEELIWLKEDPRVDPLRSDPRFVSLIKKLGLDK